KPSNIFLTSSGKVKLLDFGVAKRIGPEVTQLIEGLSNFLPDNFDLRLTHPGSAIGTVSYISPEQPDGREIDPRADIFSLGTVLYEMIAGRCAFSGRSPTDVLQAVRCQEPLPIGQLRVEVPSQLVSIIGQAQQKDLSLRYQDVR